MQSEQEQLTLLLLVADAEMQHVIDQVDASLSAMSTLVEEVLGSPVHVPQEKLPVMRAGHLLLAGGASASGHKHFAHFFPLDALAADESSNPFTVAFTNVHRARLERCSLRLHDAVADACSVPADACGSPGVEELVAASIGWFRAHDLSHFWSPETTVPMPARDQPTLTPFERITLEEALADVLGVICAAEIFDHDALSLAFSAEMLRYLSRRYREFADSAAAVLELGWLMQRTGPPWSGTRASLGAAIEAFRELAPLLQHALHTGRGLPQLRTAMDAGICEVTRLLPLLESVPTDLEYCFG